MVVPWEQLAEEIRVMRLSPTEAVQEALEAWVQECTPPAHWAVSFYQALRLVELLGTKGYRLRPIYDRDKDRQGS